MQALPHPGPALPYPQRPLSPANATPSSARRALRWLPATSIALVTAGAWLAFFSGGMRAVLAWLSLLTIVPLLGFVTVVVVGVHLVRKRSLGAPMIASAAVGVMAMLPGAWNFGLGTIAFPYSLATATPAATGRIPLDGPVRVAWGGDDVEHNAHAATPDQRWAYDLVVEPAGNGSKRLEDYGCYGEPVLSPLDATVHHVIDGERDEVPGELSGNAEAPLGNAVVLRTDTATYVVLAHLQPHSIVVAPGAVVHEGELLGKCGNSGNTSEPHVHIHHQRQDPKTRPVNFAEGLPLFFRDHEGAAMPRGGMKMVGDTTMLTGDLVEHGPRRAMNGECAGDPPRGRTPWAR